MKDATKVLFQEEWMSKKNYAVSYPAKTFYYETLKEALATFHMLAIYRGGMFFKDEKVVNALKEAGYFAVRERQIGIYSLRGEKGGDTDAESGAGTGTEKEI